ncbi:glycoside hydrolase family 3 protein [Shewanella maritima]|uniref:beta-glucosidase n=1 Tax=Shewanella maritima TaxID=2520507 RepID=UPI003736ACEB
MFRLLMSITLFFSLLTSVNSQTTIGHQAIEKKIQAMTLSEKIDFIGGYNDFYIRGYEHLGIPQIRISDGPVGVRNFGKSTAYPAAIGLAASFDKSLAYDFGKAIALEARAKNVHLLLGPGLNIYRLPITGRNFEYFGEDPHLAAQTSVAYINGMQDQGVMADAKHYLANNQEFNRNHVSSDMDERTMHEIYLAAFKPTVTQANVATVMAGYNLVNGIHMSEHHQLNNEILKGDWGFEGFIVSDWVATYDAKNAANGGLDLEMPSAAFMNQQNLIPLLNSGAVDEATIDDKVRRILRTYDRFGLFKQSDLSQGFTLDEAWVRQVAIDAARSGTVLLKNNSILPLERDKPARIGVIGPNGNRVVTGGGGSSGVAPLHPLSLVNALKQISHQGTDIVSDSGVFTGAPYPENLWDDFPLYIYQDDQKVQGTHAEFYLGTELQGDPVHKQFFDWLKLENEQLWQFPTVPKTDFSVRFTSFYSPKTTGYYSIGGIGDDGYRIILNDIEVVSLWRNQGPTAAKHEVFMNAGEEYKVVVEFYQAGGGATIQLGIKPAEMSKSPDDYSAPAIALAKDVDYVIMAVGFDWQTEGESYDRSFEMPYNQSELINQVAEVNNNVIVIINSGGNVEMESWIDKVNAVLMAWYPGQEGTLALAEILYGDTNPSGKLPASFAKRIEENPAYPFYFDDDGDLRVFYGEGIFLGYRYWDKVQQKPRFPFGYGLSYTQFEYTQLEISADKINTTENLTAKVTIKNIGQRAGSEVIQVYVEDIESRLPRPIKELKGYEKVHLLPGESKTVSMTLTPDDFSFYDPMLKKWVVEPGKFKVHAAASSDDIKQSAKFEIRP